MSEETETPEELNARYASALLPLTVTFGIFTVIGVVGNILVLLVYSLGREYRNNNFRIFVICLAVIDLLTSAFLLPAEMIKHRNFFSFENLAMCKIKCMLNVWAGCAAALTLLIISVDRFRKVCQPLKKQIPPRIALKLCLAFSFIVPSVLSTPGAIMCGIRHTNKTNIYNTTTEIYLCETEDKYQESILRKIYKYTFVILLVGISVVCVVMYIRIGRQIARHWGSVPGSFRKDSSKEFNSDYSSDTFGNLRTGQKSLDRTASSASDNNSVASGLTSPIVKTPLSKMDSTGSTKKAPFVKQNSTLSSEGDEKPKNKAKFVKQASSLSFTFSQGRKSSNKQRTMSRQGSGFGMRQFPYKTLIWFILTVVFILCYLVYIVLSTRVSTLYAKEPVPFTIFTLFFRLYFINNIINPIVYALLDKKFRSSCKNIWPNIKKACCA